MTKEDIEKKFNDELDLYDIYNIEYDEVKNKLITLSIELNFKEQFINEPNKKFIDYLVNSCYFDVDEWMKQTTFRDNLITIILTYDNGKITALFPDNNNVEFRLIDFSKSFLRKILQDWNLYN